MREQAEAQRTQMQSYFNSMAPARPQMPEAMAKRMEESKARHDEMVKEMEARRAEIIKQMDKRRQVSMQHKPFERPAFGPRKEI